MKVVIRSSLQISLVVLITLLSNFSAFGQRRQTGVVSRPATNGAQQNGELAPSRAPVGVNVADYLFGPNDIVNISIADSPEISGAFQISETGYITLPLIGQVKAEGLNGVQLTTSISEKLKSAELVTEPLISIAIEEYHSRKVLVLGAVARPAAYPLQRSTSVLDVISIAGGLAPNAGNIVTIAHKMDTTGISQPVITVDLAQLIQGRDAMGNIEIHTGDVVSVSTAPLIYVVGAVKKPGGFVIEDPSSGVTVMQAVALAEGLDSVAAPKRALLLRRTKDGTPQQELPIDIASILNRKVGDRSLEPNDILYIPESGSKKTLHTMARVAEQGITGIATYGLGLRVAAF